MGRLTGSYLLILVCFSCKLNLALLLFPSDRPAEAIADQRLLLRGRRVKLILFYRVCFHTALSCTKDGPYKPEKGILMIKQPYS